MLRSRYKCPAHCIAHSSHAGASFSFRFHTSLHTVSQRELHTSAHAAVCSGLTPLGSSVPGAHLVGCLWQPTTAGNRHECLRLLHLLLLLQVDPAIIGGMILEVGDKRVDLSIRTKVRKVQQIITESV